MCSNRLLLGQDRSVARRSAAVYSGVDRHTEVFGVAVRDLMGGSAV
jgi:hypothetical protein